MGANLCICGQPVQNLGVSSCKDLIDVAYRIIVVPEFKADGTKNEIATVAGVTKAALQTKFDAADIDDRFFALPAMENIEMQRLETVFQEFNSGNKAKIRDGIRTLVAHFPVQDTRWLGKLQSWNCQSLGIYIIDKNGNFIYHTDADAPTGVKVQPMMVYNDSFDATYVWKTESEVSMIRLAFDFKQSVQDKRLRYIAAEDLDFDGTSADLYSLNDANGVASAISTTGFTMTITTDYGLPVKGLLTGDFAIYNVTDAASVTAVTFAESADGVYAFTFAAQTSADVLRLTPTKSRYDFADVISVVITIP